MAENEKWQEKRSHPRYHKQLEVSYTILCSTDATPLEYGQTATENISQSGVCIISDEEIPVPILVQMNITMPKRKFGILIMGKTVWCKFSESLKKYKIGVKFVGLLPPDLETAIQDELDEIDDIDE